MSSDDPSKKQAQRLISSVVFIALLAGLFLAAAFGLLLHFGFGVSYDRMFQLTAHAFRR